MSITVKATQLGYHGLKRRKVGDVFEIGDEKEFSKKWMKKVNDDPDDAAGKNRAREEATEDKRRADEGAEADRTRAREADAADRNRAR